MKKTRKRIILRESGTIFLNGVLYRNPVLVGALGLFPVISGGTNLRDALFLSVMLLAMMLPVCAVSCLLLEKVPAWFRPGAVLLLSAAAFLPARLLAEAWVPGTSSVLVLCTPLMISNSVLLSRANEYAPTHLLPAAAADALGCTLGFSLVLLLVSALREFLSQSVFPGSTDFLGGMVRNAGSLSFTGLLLLGFLAAFLQSLNLERAKRNPKGGNEE